VEWRAADSTPPRVVQRGEEEVSRLVLARLGGESPDVSASRLTDFAMVLRTVAPWTYRRMRRRW
jgi:hypothetical protein